MYAVKKLTVIGRPQSKEDDVERITAENHRRRTASDEVKAWNKFMEEKARKEASAARRRTWLHFATFASYASFGFALSATAFFAALNDLDALSGSVAFLSLTLIASLFCAERLNRC